MGSSWNRYWREKGHKTKHRVEGYRSIDSSCIYDGRSYPFKEGEESFIHGCWFKAFSTYMLPSMPNVKVFSYTVPVVSTECNYGKSRHWFLCPLPCCNRRCKKLYMIPGPGLFVCRKCLNLAYASQNRSQLDRIIDKKWALLYKLDKEAEWSGYLVKPKRMHWKTFERIKDEIEALDEAACEGIARMSKGVFFS